MKNHASYWKDKIALVAGGSSGIGLAISRLLAQQGAHVWIVARRREVLETALKEIKAACQSTSQRCGFFVADVSDAGQASAAVAHVTTQAGVPDLVVNSAGITQPGYVQELSLDIFRSMIDVDYLGTVYITQAVLPGMLRRGSGHIVNIISLAAIFGTFGYSAYGAAKFAVRGYSDVIRSELKPLGIHVSAVFPPDTDTPQLAYEQPFKPYETKAISGNAKVMSPETVARETLQQAARGRYIILPGPDARLYYWLVTHTGNLVYPVLDWMVARARKKKRS